MRIPITALAILTATSVCAEGFANRDLTRVVTDAQAALGSRFASRAAPQRLTFNCVGCQGSQMIDIVIGSQTDGTEARVRSGQTSVSDLETICQSRNPKCRVTALSVAPAVGWISSYSFGSTSGSTAVILRDGDMLTIRSLADDSATARRNAEILAKEVVPGIVGR